MIIVIVVKKLRYVSYGKVVSYITISCLIRSQLNLHLQALSNAFSTFWVYCFWKWSVSKYHYQYDFVGCEQQLTVILAEKRCQYQLLSNSSVDSWYLRSSLWSYLKVWRVERLKRDTIRYVPIPEELAVWRKFSAQSGKLEPVSGGRNAFKRADSKLWNTYDRTFKCHAHALIDTKFKHFFPCKKLRNTTQMNVRKLRF